MTYKIWKEVNPYSNIKFAQILNKWSRTIRVGIYLFEFNSPNTRTIDKIRFTGFNGEHFR